MSVQFRYTVHDTSFAKQPATNAKYSKLFRVTENRRREDFLVTYRDGGRDLSTSVYSVNLFNCFMMDLVINNVITRLNM